MSIILDVKTDIHLLNFVQEDFIWPELTVRSKLSGAAEIKGKLSDAGQSLFRLSPLGHWLDFTHKSRGDPLLIVLFLQQQVQVTNPDPETLFFSIGPHTRRFGPAEFMLLTGLPFGSRPSLSHRQTCTAPVKNPNRFIKNRFFYKPVRF